ncbi:MAG: hypothetical protein IH861_14675 [Chloroflexi bacterium]|nr:hypothetical protein [Chloroflexota bacterium]
MSSIPSNEELRAQASTSSSIIKVAGVLWFAAFMIVMIASIAFLVVASTAGDYYANSKAVRDAAEAGSAVLSQLGSIAAVTDWALPFAFVGIATFIAGFGFAFVNILRNVRLRGNTMAAALPELKARKSQG